ncbi:DUF441 domain-containing protein [Sulfobacillus thermosulfidooxidans]|uniref:UPF0756 membrane protein SAMN00768000_3383 n=2 Tax=Sulfobacillus thermosulfidooxidans TaxID=28034 RepID=A0A1W1WMF0_SULTA|nr:DUF441 domain-containing protein [Sulfobacillus thermosulfidooxidans]OLZ09702.1 hypothetical protein BFX05_12155 [Sulfobacillus thermosulfidooxidans]OLZ15991.1 hypothetical protein BFX06_02885 [Sulfobacillus thermosulfidooxidans]OLZ18161.1 hypothetical protein BFX07_07240 [Sulfobacillus thermosulfidooxidans]PSR29908.1 MAG: DUF441 domain-containing protein [Sulfobacillus thermosulfidooxidans]SMC07426.1 Uncharacterized membrane protein, DUF441 family [Sulfobacillus thermosulfidooxidans DSM 92
MFTTETIGLMILLLLGMWARSNLVAASAAILLVIRFTRMTFLYPVLERRGVEIGLLFLTMAMLVPFALGKVNIKEVFQSFLTIPGILAVVGGAVATNLNGRGLQLLAENSHLMFGLIVGSIIGIVFWGGIPVGPLMAAGTTYLMLEVIGWLGHLMR